MTNIGIYRCKLWHTCLETADVLRVAADLRDTYGYPQHVFMYGLAKVKAAKERKNIRCIIRNWLYGSASYNMALQSIDDIVLTNIKRTDIALRRKFNLSKKSLKPKVLKEIKVELILGLPGFQQLMFFINEMESISRV